MFRLMSIPVRAARGPMERALDEVLAGPLPEALARSVVEHKVLERFVGELARHGELETLTVSALESEQAARFVRELMASPGLERLLTEAVESPASSRLVNKLMQDPELQRALRKALSSQTAGFADEVILGVRHGAAGADDRAERLPRRLFGKQPRAGSVPFAGVGTRGVALAIDAILAQLLFVTVVALIQLVASLFGGLKPHWLAASIGGAGWVITVTAYFVAFWSSAGQTPGMRLLGLRVRTADGTPPRPLRSLVRFVGLVLAIVPLFAGIFPALVDNRRRALQDFLASTTVVYTEPDRPSSGGA